MFVFEVSITADICTVNLIIRKNTQCSAYLTTLFCMFFRFEIEIEPIFGTLALYDVKEKKKVIFVKVDHFLFGTIALLQ